MEPDDLALSDVHIGQQYTKTETTPGGRGCSLQLDTLQYEVVVSRFPFLHLHTQRDTWDRECCDIPHCDMRLDGDGDPVLERTIKYNEVITIEHTLSTRLVDVGLQVWQGSLLLSDFILNQVQMFDGTCALELGGGVGLASITMATVARHVICTDVGDCILELCSRNAECNKDLYKYGQPQGKQSTVMVRELDWLKDYIPQDTSSLYGWSETDAILLDKVTVIIAADVVYDDKLTVGFFETIQRLMSKRPSKTLYLALEKRLNFTLDNLEVACPAYIHFLECLEKLCRCEKIADESEASWDGIRFTAKQLKTDFPQCFEYDRSKHLILWEITATFESGCKTIQTACETS